MRELRAVLLGVPPLLGDIIRRPLAKRLAASDVALTIVEPAGLAAAPDVLIIRRGAPPLPPELLAAAPAILTLSADLTKFSGPAPNQVTACTPDSLAAALLAVANDLPPP